jgi:hypothetical protein
VGFGVKSQKLEAVAGLGAEPPKIWPFFACKSTGNLYKLRVILFKIFKIFSAIYLADSAKFQIHMINSLVSLHSHWAEICRLDNRLSQTTPCRHCSWCICQRCKLGRVPQKRPPGCAQESSARIIRYLTPKGINSQAQSLYK